MFCFSKYDCKLRKRFEYSPLGLPMRKYERLLEVKDFFNRFMIVNSIKCDCKKVLKSSQFSYLVSDLRTIRLRSTIFRIRLCELIEIIWEEIKWFKESLSG